MISNRFPGLDDLAFEGRNKDYGAYYLRKNYYRFLLVSVASGIFIVSLAVSISWFLYYFEPIPLVEGEMIYAVEYYNMSPPPDDETNKVAQAFAKPVQEIEQVPLVTDSVRPDKEKPVEEPPVEKPETVKTNTDSAAKPGGSGLGAGIGSDAGLATSIDVYPRYPGGDESRLYYLRKQVRYPEAALKALVQGTVMVVFVVELDGSISNVDVAKKIGGGCDEEAIRVTREMPHWEPGKRNGRAVRVLVRMPIVFRIPGKPASFK
ncbi:MAG: TonB family protein [Bacteroidetes bacterium]|nr:TonB family protein [Bacteroidota bacterium]